MKLLFIVACIGLAASASVRTGHLSARTPRELWYQYDAQVATGIEEVSGDFSTVRMRFRVRMRTAGRLDADTGAEKWTLAFTEVTVGQRNNATERLPKSLLPVGEFRNLESPELWTQAELALRKPFAVLLRPRELSVAKVFFSEGDPFWSVNIKKGFLSLLQLDFAPKGASSDVGRQQWTKEIDEMTVAAICKTFYSVNKVDYHESDSPVFRVEKAIDFNSCLNPIDGTRGLAGAWNGLRHEERLPGERLDNIVSVNNMAQYLVDMGSDGASPVIRKASARTVHILSPHSDSTHGSEKIFSVQKMKLLTGEASSAISEDAETAEAGDALTEQAEGLRLIYPKEAKNVNRQALLREAARLFRGLWQAGDESEIDARSYEQIVRILRLYLKTPEDLEALARQLASHPTPQRALTAFITDICPQVASHGSIQFLMRVVQAVAKTGRPMSALDQARLTVHHIPAIFAKLSMTGKIQLQTLKAVFEVVNSEAFAAKTMTPEFMPIFSSAWLSLGAMVNVFYGRQAGLEPYEHPLPDASAAAAPWELRRVQAARSGEFRRLFIAKVTDGLKQTDAWHNLALKVTQNCGLFELYEQIGPMIRKRDTGAVAERVQAVYATQNMLRRNTLVRFTTEDSGAALEEKYIRRDREYTRHFETVSSRIQADLVACFRNVREDPELRIACYRVLMQCPSVKQSVLNMLMQTILTEPTQQVYAYCISHMSQVADSSLPRYQRVSRAVRSALSMLKRREPLDQTHSRVFHGQFWDELHKLGFTLETDLIVSDKAFVPRWTHIRIEHQAIGQNVPVLELGLRTEGLQGLLGKLFGPRGRIYKAAGDVERLLRRATRSLDDELLGILPSVLEMAPSLDLTVALMGYNVIHAKNWLSAVGKVLKPFAGLSTISANYELPTPAGTILDLNCFLTLNFWPKVAAQTEVSEEGKAKLRVKASLPTVIKGFKRFGSNMHILNHYQQWLTTVKISKQLSQEFVFQADLTSPSKSVLSLLWAAPGTRTPIVQFKNAAYSTFTESVFQGDSIETVNKNETIVHRKIAEQKTVDFYPALGHLLAPLGYRLHVTGKHFSTEQLYEAPCGLLTGPSEFSVLLVPTTEEETGRAVFISSGLEIRHPDETSPAKPPQVKLHVNSVRIQSDGREAIRQKLVSAEFTPKEWTADRLTFQCTLRYHLNLPSSYRANGYQLKVNGQVELPEDLRMTPRSLPLKPEEWFASRQLRILLAVTDDEDSEVAIINVQLTSNSELKKLLVDSGLTESQMVKMFPRLVQCLNEAEKSIQEEPLAANALFTPTCIRQFKEFNKLSQTKIEITKRANWFLNPKSCPLLEAAIWKMTDSLKPYLVSSEMPESSEGSRVIIVARPSPDDLRVQHLNVTCPYRQMVWRSVQLPFVPFFWSGVDPILTSAIDYAKGGASKCSLRHSHIRTFDNVVYSIPKTLFSEIAENKCPVLLAKDCSRSKEFQVLVDIKEGRKYITLNLKTDGSRPFVVEVSKSISDEQLKSTVTVNGIELEHSAELDKETEILRRRVNTEKGPVTVVISTYRYAGTIMYRISGVEHQLQLLLGGRKLRTVELRVSPFYRNRICGLCGDYNAESFQEFRDPSWHRVAASAGQMVQQYVLPVSESCRLNRQLPDDLPDDSGTPSSELRLPNFYAFESPRTAKRRSSCQILVGQKSQRVKTFRHAEVKLMSPALRQILSDTECDLKLAVARLGDRQVRVYLRSGSSELLVQVGDQFRQRLSLASLATNTRSSNPLPSGLAAELQASDSRVNFHLSHGDNRVTVKISSDKRVTVKASQIDDSEEAVCELSDPSQMLPADGASLLETLKKVTNAGESSTCLNQLRKRVNQCRVSPDRVQPFHRSGEESNWQQLRFLDAKLRNSLAETKAPLILSVDKIADETAAYSVQLVQEAAVRRILLKRNRQTLVQISLPESATRRAEATVTYQQGGSERSLLVSSGSSEPIARDVDNNFRLVASSERVLVGHKSSLYELEVQQPASGREAEVVIVRPHGHPSYPSAGLCQAGRLSQVLEHRSNPRAVLAGVLRAALLQAESAEAAPPVATEEEVARVSRLLAEIRDDDE